VIAQRRSGRRSGRVPEEQKETGLFTQKESGEPLTVKVFRKSSLAKKVSRRGLKNWAVTARPREGIKTEKKKKREDEKREISQISPSRRTKEERQKNRRSRTSKEEGPANRVRGNQLQKKEKDETCWFKRKNVSTVRQQEKGIKAVLRDER